MKLTLICLCAILCNRLVGEPRRWNPLTGFVWLAQCLEVVCYGPPELRVSLRLLLGMLGLLLMIVPAALLAWGLAAVPYLGMMAEGGLLYLALQVADLERYTRAVAKALQDNDLQQARAQVNRLVNRDTGDMGEEEISLAMVETVLKRGCIGILGVLFWFLVAGAPGVVVYRLVTVLDTLWGHATPRYRYFGGATACLNDALNWLPARLTALSYSLVGDRETAWRCWRKQASVWRSVNTGPLLAAGAGALNLQLGGVARYYDREVLRPALGEGLLPCRQDIERVVNLVNWSIGLWIVLLFLGEWWLVWAYEPLSQA